MASRKTKKKQLPMDLPLTKRVARRMGPPSGFDAKMMRSEINYNQATHAWIRYQILLVLNDKRARTTTQLAQQIGLTEKVAQRHIDNLIEQGAIRRINRKVTARKYGLEWYVRTYTVYSLSQKAKNAVKAERKVMKHE